MTVRVRFPDRQPYSQEATMTARQCIRLALVALVSLAIAGVASAQDWPARNVTVVVPLAAGSASDIMARVVMDQVGRQLGKTFVIENRPGAGGTVGANAVANSAPDGHTILAYDTLTAFAPVIPFGQQPLVLITSPAKGYKTLRDLIAAGKVRPGALNYSSAGVGTASHFAAERLRISAGFTAQHIPFRGAAEAVTEVVAERADFSAQLPSTTLQLIGEGKLVALAVSADKRAATMPQVPTTLEAGLPADSIYPFYSGLFLPAKTPRAIVEKLHQEAAKAMREPAVQERFKQLGVEAMPMTVGEFEKFFKGDVDAAVALVQAANIPRQ